MNSNSNETAEGASISDAGLGVDRLRREVTILNECLRKKNVALDALHWVWCDGGCDSGTHRHFPDELTEAMVLAAERNTKRMRAWYENAAFRQRWSRMSSEERNAWFAERAKTANKD